MLKLGELSYLFELGYKNKKNLNMAAFIGLNGVSGVSECDLEDFDPVRPFTWAGYRTFFPLEREGCGKKRLLCFVKSSIEVKERTDLMSDKLSNVWIEIQGNHQKILICTVYREFGDLVSPGQLSDTEQKERWKLFMKALTLKIGGLGAKKALTI